MTDTKKEETTGAVTEQTPAAETTTTTTETKEEKKHDVEYADDDNKGVSKYIYMTSWLVRKTKIYTILTQKWRVFIRSICQRSKPRLEKKIWNAL